MPSPDKKTIKAYVSDEDYKRLAGQAAQARLSLSKFIQAVCLGYEPKSKTDQEAILAMLQTKKDLSRLGNLLKLALDQATPDENKISGLLDGINKTRALLEEKIRAF
jgi:hypothetical protein